MTMLTTDDSRRIQARLGVRPDGLFGRGSWTALLAKIGAGPERASELGLAANVHCARYGIDTPLRLTHFLAQLAHESDGFRAMEEYASGSAYEGRADLGNTEAGDGRRYKGRGPIQCTGRANYRRYGEKLGIDLERHPEILSTPSLGLLVGCLYWDEHQLNLLADRDDTVGITRAINGGLNGLEDRRARLTQAKALLL
jgi:putative chitinase